MKKMKCWLGLLCALLFISLPQAQATDALARPDSISACVDTTQTYPKNFFLPNDSGVSTITSVQGGVNVTATLNPDQSITVVPAPGFIGIGSFTYTVDNITTDNGTAVVTVQVRGLPKLSFDAVAPICPGTCTVLKVRADRSNIEFTWSTGETGNQITVCPTVDTTYTVTGTDTRGGCSVTASVTVHVTDTPTVTVNNAEICVGGSATLTANANGGTILWSTGETTPSITVNPAVDTEYTVTVTSPGGCKATATAKVKVHPTPTVTVNDAIICVGGSATLTANATGGTVLWSNGATTPSITVSPTVDTDYVVTVVSPGGCTATATAHVKVTPTPTVSIAGDNKMCVGGSVTLTATANGGTILWSTGATTPSITVSPASTTTYTVIVAAAGGCTATASHTVTVHPKPTVTVNSPSICIGESATLTANATGGTILWSTGSTASSITVSPTANQTYTVTVTSPGGCAVSATATVTVNNKPNVAVTVVNPEICVGGSATLTANTTESWVQWSTGETTKSITVSPTSTTTYTVTVKNSSGCSATATGTVKVIAPPTASVSDVTICKGESATITVTTTASEVEWSTGETTKTITVSPIVTTTYTVTVGSGSCELTKSVTVTVKACATNPGTGTPGYWMNKPNAWPVESITIGGRVYSKSAAIKLMKQSTSTDMTYVMFAHLVAAKLNVLIGNDSSCISNYITWGDMWMTAYPVGSGVSGSSDAWKKQGEPIKNQLDLYNNGKLCAPSRG